MSEKRQVLINTAIALFVKKGFYATGIDLIAQEAKVSKKTMYQYFDSKEALILAALKYHDELFRSHFMDSVNQIPGTPADRLLGIFDVAHAWFSEKDFYGCMFINAIGEYSKQDTPIRKACQDFKERMISYIEELAILAKVEKPFELAGTLSLLLEGSIVTAQIVNTPDSACTAKTAAQVLIKSAIR